MLITVIDLSFIRDLRARIRHHGL